MLSGANTSNLTATRELFTRYSRVTYWRFEVVYSFPSKTSTSALNFHINDPPSEGHCSIYPSSGDTRTLFTIGCYNWYDEQEIQDFSFYGNIATL